MFKKFTNVQVVARQTRYGSRYQTKIYVVDVEVFFPYSLLKATVDTNDIDYAIAKTEFSLSLVAIAVRVNDLMIEQVSNALWSTDSASDMTIHNDSTENVDLNSKQDDVVDDNTASNNMTRDDLTKDKPINKAKQSPSIDEFGKGVLLSKRIENENEYKVRQSHILYAISALCLFISLVFIFRASFLEAPSSYNFTLLLASVAFIAMLISIFVTKKNN